MALISIYYSHVTTVLALQKYRHIHVEYQCEVAKLLTLEEFKTSDLTLSTFPSHVDLERADKSPTHSSEQTPHTNRHPQACPGPDPTTPEMTSEWPVYVQLTNGKTYGCDLVVSATGVVPNTDVVKIKCDPGEGEEGREGGEGDGKEERGRGLKVCVEDGGGIVVDSGMRTSLGDVYAAGDVCSVQWEEQQAALWFQVGKSRNGNCVYAICDPNRQNIQLFIYDYCIFTPDETVDTG